MSRIGNNLILLAEGVQINIEKSLVTVKGPKGELKKKIDPDIKVLVEGKTVKLQRPTDNTRHKALHGLSRALIANMVQGVSKGYKSELELVGVGYRAQVKGQLLDFVLGYSHHIVFQLPKEIKCQVETVKGKNPTIILESIDNQLLGQIGAKIRALRKPEPYKGKGIKFVNEIIRRKAGKAAVKSGA